MSKLDQLYRSLLLTKFFVKGWGNPDNLKRIFDFRKIISCRETCKELVNPDHPIIIDEEKTYRDYKIIEGHFKSPFVDHMPGLMPKESEIAKFQMILPKIWKTKHKPVCVHLAGTGDHFFWRRRVLLAKPLIESGIASILLENPFYGCRKPKIQTRSSLHNVSDLFVMGGALVLETLVLLHWCNKQGLGPLGVTGISMGGHMASLAATNWHNPLVVVPCLSWSTASVVFTEGVMAGAIPWKLLQKQYFTDSSYSNDLLKLTNSPEKTRDHHFGIPSDFEKNFFDSKSSLKHFWQLFRFLPGAESFQTSSANMAYLPSLLNGILKNLESKSFSHHETLAFMRNIMDECTHLGNFSKPVDTNLIVIVIATSDAYYPRNSVMSLGEIWPGAEIRHVNTGHISAFLFKQDIFRKAIEDAFRKSIDKYHSF